MHPDLTPHLDVAQLVFWAFVLFFVGLVFYLRREDRREGYPVEDDLTGRVHLPGGPLSMATPKLFRLPFGHGTVANPTGGRDSLQLAARRTERFDGAPLVPTGDPLVDGIGPAAWADRAKRPDLDMEGHPRIVPIGLAPGWSIARGDADLIGWPVIGADRKVAGRIVDLWIDKADRLVRYLAVALDDAAGTVLAPMMMAKVDRRRGVVVVDALMAGQFAAAPRIDAADRITLYEEDRVQAYFGGGYLYAMPSRQEPLL